MTRITRSLLSRLRILRKRDDGNSTIEFVIMFPIVMTLFFTAVEFGIMMVHQVMLERSVDLTVRDLRLGYFDSPTQDDIRKSLCNRAAAVNDCMNNLLIEMQPVDTATWAMPGTTATCRNRGIGSIDPVGSEGEVVAGVANEIVVVRVCAVIEPLFPWTRLGGRLRNTELGGYALVASSAFVNEPG